MVTVDDFYALFADSESRLLKEVNLWQLSLD